MMPIELRPSPNFWQKIVVVITRMLVIRLVTLAEHHVNIYG